MRLYGKRKIRKHSERRVLAGVETRDAILWDVLPAQRVCRVKVQGSDELITANYPLNWESTPFWLKPGNSVRIGHKGGARGYIEVVGHGRVRPTAVAGGQSAPAVATAEDAVLNGYSVQNEYAEGPAGIVIACPNNPQMVVLITKCKIRISGTTYTRAEISMGEGDEYKMDMGGQMGVIAGAIAIDAAPSAGNFRYDKIVIGSDLVIDYVKGSNFSNTVSKPDTPSGHVLLGEILLYGGMTEITSADINRSWSAPVETQLTMTIADDDLAWAELSTTVTIAVKDQWGNPILKAGEGWYLTLEIIDGNGEVSSPEEGSSTTIIGGHTGSGSNEYVFTYTRDQADPGDESPALEAVLETNYTMQVYGNIILRDASGDPM